MTTVSVTELGTRLSDVLHEVAVDLGGAVDAEREDTMALPPMGSGFA